MRTPAWFDRALGGEMLCLFLTMPLLYFPNWLPGWAPWIAIAILVAGWIWRRRCLGIWLVRTPADWSILFLFLVMLPVAVWASPPGLREKYSIPRAYILIWNFALFWTVVTYGSRRSAHWLALAIGFMAAGMAIALIAPLGIEWADKLPGIGPIVRRIPSPLVGVFRGAESGFSGNQVAGALLYVLPLAMVVVGATFTRYKRRWLWWLACVGTLAMVVVLLVTQSRSGAMGFVAGLIAIVLLPRRWGRRLLAGGTVTIAVLLLFQFDRILALLDAVVPGDVTAQAMTLIGRIEVWDRAMYAIQDFPFTGMGLGTFRALVWLLYPPFMLSPGFDLAHAHNFFLQQALDFGVPGLIALVAIYLVVIWQVVVLWRRPFSTTAPADPILPWHTWALGFAASIIAQTVYSQTDVVAMGSKPNVLFWYLIALVLAGANRALEQPAEDTAGP